MRTALFLLCVLICHSSYASVQSVEAQFDGDIDDVSLDDKQALLMVSEGEVNSLFVLRSYLFPNMKNKRSIKHYQQVIRRVKELSPGMAKIEIIGYMNDMSDLLDRYVLIDQLSEIQKDIGRLLKGHDQHRGEVVMISSVISDVSSSIASDDDQIELRFYPAWKIEGY
ncbi:MAG: hypothetical protein CMF46_04970 [Legionellales bacterium]|nr:hypothetical protein [Legionellales bacterium]